MPVHLSIDSLIQFTKERQDDFRMATAVAINNYCRETPDKCVTTNDNSSSLRKRNNQQNLLKRYIIWHIQMIMVEVDIQVH